MLGPPSWFRDCYENNTVPMSVPDDPPMLRAPYGPEAPPRRRVSVERHPRDFESSYAAFVALSTEAKFKLLGADGFRFVESFGFVTAQDVQERTKRKISSYRSTPDQFKTKIRDFEWAYTYFSHAALFALVRFGLIEPPTQCVMLHLTIDMVSSVRRMWDPNVVSKLLAFACGANFATRRLSELDEHRRAVDLALDAINDVDLPLFWYYFTTIIKSIAGHRYHPNFKRFVEQATIPGRLDFLWYRGIAPPLSIVNTLIARFDVFSDGVVTKWAVEKGLVFVNPFKPAWNYLQHHGYYERDNRVRLSPYQFYNMYRRAVYPLYRRGAGVVVAVLYEGLLPRNHASSLRAFMERDGDGAIVSRVLDTLVRE